MFEKPTIEYAELWPLLLVFGVACLGVLVEAFVARERRYLTQTVLAFLGLLVALGGSIYVGMELDVLRDDGGDAVARGIIASGGTIVVDGPAVFIWGLVLIFAIGGVLLFAERRLEGGVSAFAGQAAALPGTEAERQASTRGLDHTEVYPLMMFAVGGMMLFASANDLLTMFVALEVLSLPLYLLCALARRRRLLSQEAALKYFLLGSFSSAFFLFGVALTYGYSGSMQFSVIGEAIRNDVGNQGLLLVGLGMLCVGLLFKVGAAPFHAWTPDVYQGAPTAVTAFMAAATKVAAFGALMRVLYVAFGSERWDWQPMLWIIAILTMLVGSVLAVVQTDVKRMLAYSSVAHTGFLLVGVLGVQSTGALGTDEVTSLQAVLFYLVAYGPATIGTFAIVTLVRDGAGEATSMARWAGLGRRSPWVALVFGFLLLSMAGIPLTGGFVGKWAVFTVALSAGAWPVVVVAILASIISVYFYVRVILLMFFSDSDTDPRADTLAGAAGTGAGATRTLVAPDLATVTKPSLLTSATIAACALVTLALGVVPGPVLDLAAQAGQFIR